MLNLFLPTNLLWRTSKRVMSFFFTQEVQERLMNMMMNVPSLPETLSHMDTRRKKCVPESIDNSQMEQGILHFNPSIKGQRVKINRDCDTACKIFDELDNAIVFSKYYVQLNKKISIQIMETGGFVGNMRIGVSTTSPNECDLPLPKDSFSEYWGTLPYCEFAEVPGCEENKVFHVVITKHGLYGGWNNQSRLLIKSKFSKDSNLWMIFDLYGFVTKIKLLNSELGNASNSICGTTNELELAEDAAEWDKASSSNAVASSSTNAVALKDNETSRGVNINSCAICDDREINCVILNCGHMCFCIECGREQFLGAGNGKCPMCRAPIKKLQKIYRC